MGPLLLLSAAAAAPEPAVKRDVQCFVLYAVGVAGAKDDKQKEGASLGLMYFFTKLKYEVPSPDLASIVAQEADVIGNDPALKENADSCDKEFQARGKELMDLGDQMRSAISSHQSS